MGVTDLWRQVVSLCGYGSEKPAEVVFVKRLREDCIDCCEYRLRSADPEKPFVISGELERSSRGQEFRIVINISNALHPQDSHFSSGMFGDRNKNPAFW